MGTTEIQPAITFTDRSRAEEYQACARSRWWAYEWGRGLSSPSKDVEMYGAFHPDRPVYRHVGGVSPAKQSRDLLIGIGVHVGMGWLLDSHPEDVYALRHAVDEAVGTYWNDVNKRGLALRAPTPDIYDFFCQEGAALVEGLIRMAAIRILPSLLARYDVVDVEREERLELAPRLIFQVRPDALLRERDTGDLAILSWKTAGEYGAAKEDEFRHDAQGLSETLAVEARIAPERISWVQMVFLLKGARRKDTRVEGRKINYSPLTRAWMLEGPVRQWAWSYEVPKEKKDGTPYMGKLGGDWRGVSVWDNYPGGTKAWIDALAAGEVQPEWGDPLAQCYAVPEPWPRSERDMQDWLVETEFQEVSLAELASIATERRENAGAEGCRSFLNCHFPKTRAICGNRWGHPCVYEQLCYGPDHVAEDPLNNGYRLREPHHPGELVEVQGGGE